MSGIFSYVQLLRRRMQDVDTRMSALSQSYASLKAVKTDTEIEKIQEFGETALISILIPYYLGAALFYYAFNLKDAPAVWAWQLLLTLFSGIVILRVGWRMIKERAVKAAPLSILAFFALHLLLVWVLLPEYVEGLPEETEGYQKNQAGA